MKHLILLLIPACLWLIACDQDPSQPLGEVVIVSPHANQELVTATDIHVEGSVVDGASVEVAIGEATPVTATLAAASAGRRTWSAELTAPAPGSHTITATAAGLADGPKTASVAVKIIAMQAAGRWDGEFEVFDATPAREKVTGGSMVIFYNSGWFRMYFGATEVNGTTDNWDLLDKGGLRIKGTYHAAGETNRFGNVMREAWVDYDAVLDDGKILEGFATAGD